MKYSDYDNINEGKVHDFFDDNKFLSYWRKVFMGAEIHPHQNYDETLKKHEYPGYLKYIQTRKYLSDLNYIRQDLNSAITFYANLKKIYSEYKRGNKYQDNTVCKKLDKAGVDIKDFDPTIKFFKTTCRDAITERIKELKEKYPRESTEMHMEGGIVSYNNYNNI